MIETQSRWKSPVLWLTGIVMITGALISSGIFTADMTLRIIGLVGGVASGIIGIINIPNNKYPNIAPK